MNDELFWYLVAAAISLLLVVIVPVLFVRAKREWPEKCAHCGFWVVKQMKEVQFNDGDGYSSIYWYECAKCHKITRVNFRGAMRTGRTARILGDDECVPPDGFGAWGDRITFAARRK